MPFPLDCSDCTSRAQDLDVPQSPVRSAIDGVSSRPAWFSGVQNAKLRTLTFRCLNYSFLPVSLAGVLLAGTVLPSARTTTAVRPLAASYAVSGVLGAYVSDFPVVDDAAVDEAAGVEGTLSFGAPIAAPPSAPIVGTTTDANVNLRRGPSTTHAVIAKLPSGTTLEVIGQQTGWYRVATATGTVGWVVDDFFKVAAAPAAGTAQVARSTVTATISQSRVNLRKGPDTTHASYGKMAAGTQVQVLGRTGDWYQVRSPRGTIGWVASSLLTISANVTRAVPITSDVPTAPTVAKTPPAAAATTPSTPATASSSDAGRLAQRYVGARYVWGGSSPRGFDCSGLVQYVYRQLGVRLPRKASAQYAQTRGKRIGSLGSLAPGDLVFFVRTTSARGITHVGLYVGNGMMVTANSPRTGVQKVSVYGKYWSSRFAGGVRPAR